MIWLRHQLWLVWWDIRGCWFAVRELGWDDERVQRERRKRFE